MEYDRNITGPVITIEDVQESRMLSESLREQANALRLLATYFEAHLIRDDLLRLAERCEEVADEIEREITEHRSIRG
jgi:hypothetical protein